MIPLRRLRRLASAVAVVGCWVLPVRAGAVRFVVAWFLPITAVPPQEFPTRTVRLVVAFPPGGPTDFVARLLADKVKTILGQNVIVENKPGANGVIGGDAVAKSEPDGHTLWLTTAGAVAITPGMRADMPYN